MAISMACLLNQAAVCLKQKRWKAAVDVCNSVLTFDSGSVKAYFRRAQAYEGLAVLDEAEHDFAAAVRLQKRPKERAAIYKEWSRVRQLLGMPPPPVLASISGSEGVTALQPPKPPQNAPASGTGDTPSSHRVIIEEDDDADGEQEEAHCIPPGPILSGVQARRDRRGRLTVRVPPLASITPGY